MELSDLDNDPRPKASQVVAAKYRTQGTIRPLLPAPLQRNITPIAIGTVVLLLAIALTSVRPTIAPTAPEQRTTGMSAFTPPDQPTAAPAPTAEPEEERLLVYGAPNGAVLGPIERDRQIRAVAHYGEGWIQADVEGSGLVWIRLVDLPSLPITGPDLAPKPAPQTGQGQPWIPPAPAVEEKQPAAPIVPAPTTAPAPGLTVAPGSDPQSTPPPLYQPRPRAVNLEASKPSDNPGFDAGVEPGMEPTPVQ